MRYTLFIIFASFFSLAGSVWAEESKSESVGSVHHTPHPPHDHPDNDHLKKLDEGVRRRKERR